MWLLLCSVNVPEYSILVVFAYQSPSNSSTSGTSELHSRSSSTTAKALVAAFMEKERIRWRHILASEATIYGNISSWIAFHNRATCIETVVAWKFVNV
jgi:predicted component of type VI protein secretion system